MKLEFMNEEYDVRFVKGTYFNNENLYVGLQNIDKDTGEWDSFCDITVNFDEKCPEGCGFLKVSDLSKEVFSLIRPYISETGRCMEGDFVKYPEVEFDKNFLNQAIELM